MDFAIVYCRMTRYKVHLFIILQHRVVKQNDWLTGYVFLNGMSCGVYVYVYIVCLCVSTMPMLSAELHDFLVKFRLLLCSHIQE